MSIETDGVQIQYQQRTYTIFPSVCEEFPDQLDFVRIVFGGLDVCTITPRHATSELEVLAVNRARAAISQLQWDTGDVLDPADV